MSPSALDAWKRGRCLKLHAASLLLSCRVTQLRQLCQSTEFTPARMTGADGAADNAAGNAADGNENNYTSSSIRRCVEQAESPPAPESSDAR